jgi:hypothetical protein
MAIGGGGKNKGVRKGIRFLEIRRAKRALRLFTNRDDERKILADFLHTIDTDKLKLEKPFFNFYGIDLRIHKFTDRLCFTYTPQTRPL